MLLVFGLSMLSLFSCLSNHDPHFHRIKSSAQSQVVRPVQSVGISPSFGWPYSVSRGGLFSTSIFWTRLLSRFSLPIELAPGSWIQSVKHINMLVKCQRAGEMPTYQHINMPVKCQHINISTYQHAGEMSTCRWNANITSLLKFEGEGSQRPSLNFEFSSRLWSCTSCSNLFCKN